MHRLLVGTTRRGFVAGTGAAALALSAPALAQGQARRALVVGVQDNPPMLDPLRITTNVTYRVTANIYDFLIRTDHANGGRRVPGLAESWRMVDPRIWDFKIRPGVVFHDGSVMTAEDVAFSLGPQRILTDGLPSAGISRQFFSGFESVTALDAGTVRFVTKDPDPLFEFRLAGWGSQIISKAAFERTNNWDRWAQAPVATGPYKVAEVRAGELIRLEAHDAYWGGRPPFSQISFRVVPEAASRVNALAAGDVDLVTEVTPDQIADIEQRSGLHVVGGAINNIRVLHYGTFGGPLADVRLRRALNLAIDREAIAKQLLDGRVGVPRGHQFPGYGDMYVSEFAGPRHDPDAARALLREANYNGQPIDYRTTAIYYTAELATAQVLQQMWEAVGFRINLRVVENWGQVFAQPLNAIFNGSMTMVYPDMLGGLYVWYGPNGFIRNQARSWRNDEFDAIGERMMRPIERDERRRLHARSLEIFNWDDPPGTVLHETGMFYGKRRNIAWEPQATPMMDFGPFNPAVSSG